MLLKKSQIVVLDTLNFTPYYTNNINNIELNSGMAINHFKINDEKTYQDQNFETLLITSLKEDGSSKSAEDIYYMLGSWDSSTLLNSYFSNDFEAGSVGASGEEITGLIIKRLSPETNYSSYETIGEIPFEKGTTTYFRDYLIESGQVYLYSVQPKTASGYGQIQSKVAGLNTYEFSWILDQNGNQLRIANSSISNIVLNTKDTVVETIGGSYPFVNRYSSLDYRTFTLTGTIATELDIDKDYFTKADEAIYGKTSKGSSNYELIHQKFLEKYGQAPQSRQGHMSVDTAHERLFRDSILKMFKDGQSKIYKSDTEGLMLVKFSGLNITPKTVLGRILYDFSVTVVEIGKVTPELIKQFVGLNKMPNFEIPEREQGESDASYEERYDLAEFNGR